MMATPASCAGRRCSGRIGLAGEGQIFLLSGDRMIEIGGRSRQGPESARGRAHEGKGLGTRRISRSRAISARDVQVPVPSSASSSRSFSPRRAVLRYCSKGEDRSRHSASRSGSPHNGHVIRHPRKLASQDRVRLHMPQATARTDLRRPRGDEPVRGLRNICEGHSPHRVPLGGEHRGQA